MPAKRPPVSTPARPAREPDRPLRATKGKEPQRIAKLLARAGVASRREIERMIAEGRVAIDGVAIDTPATIVTSLHGVTVDGNPVAAPAPARLFLFHKPPGFLTAERDPRGRATIYDKLPEDLPRVVPVGRLDLATEGLLLLTTDGVLKRTLELPATGVPRTYRARAYGTVTQAQLEDLIDGVEIEGIRYGSIDANMERRTGRNGWIELTLAEGKNREVRRVLEHMGLQVSRLIRTAYGPFTLGDLPPGAVEEIRQHDLIAFRKSLEKGGARMKPVAPSSGGEGTSPPAPRPRPVTPPRAATPRAAADERPAYASRGRSGDGEAAPRPTRTIAPRGERSGGTSTAAPRARPAGRVADRHDRDTAPRPVRTRGARPVETPALPARDKPAGRFGSRTDRDSAIRPARSTAGRDQPERSGDKPAYGARARPAGRIGDDRDSAPRPSRAAFPRGDRPERSGDKPSGRFGDGPGRDSARTAAPRVERGERPRGRPADGADARPGFTPRGKPARSSDTPTTDPAAKPGGRRPTGRPTTPGSPSRPTRPRRS